MLLCAEIMTCCRAEKPIWKSSVRQGSSDPRCQPLSVPKRALSCVITDTLQKSWFTALHQMPPGWAKPLFRQARIGSYDNYHPEVCNAHSGNMRLCRFNLKSLCFVLKLIRHLQTKTCSQCLWEAVNLQSVQHCLWDGPDNVSWAFLISFSFSLILHLSF